MSDLDISRCAALLNLHIVYGRRSGDQQEFRAAQAGTCGPVYLGVPSAHLPLAHPPGQDTPGDSSSHWSRKTSSTGHCNLPHAGRHGASCCPQRPLIRGHSPLLVSLGFVGTSGLRETQPGSMWALGQFILMPVG